MPGLRGLLAKRTESIKVIMCSAIRKFFVCFGKELAVTLAREMFAASVKFLALFKMDYILYQYRDSTHNLGFVHY